MGEIPEGTPVAGPADGPQLAQAAKACGIETEYWDVWGKQHHSSADTQTAILRSLGVDASTPASLERALEERSWREWQRLLRIGPHAGGRAAVRRMRLHHDTQRELL